MRYTYIEIKDLRSNKILLNAATVEENYVKTAIDYFTRFLPLTASDKYELESRLGEYENCEFLGYLITVKDKYTASSDTKPKKSYVEYISALINSELEAIGYTGGDVHFIDDADKEYFIQELTARIDRDEYLFITQEENYKYLTVDYYDNFKFFKDYVVNELGTFPLDLKTEAGEIRAAMEIFYINRYFDDWRIDNC